MKVKMVLATAVALLCAAGWLGYRYHKGTRNLDLAMRDMDYGIQYCTAEIERSPESPAAWSNRGTFHFNRGYLAMVRGLPDSKADFEQAVSDYTKAIELEPVYGDSYGASMAGHCTMRGRAYFHQGDYPSAISDFSKAIDFNPEDRSAFFHRGIAREKIGDLCGASRDLRGACDLKFREACKAEEGLRAVKLEDCPPESLAGSPSAEIPREVLEEVNRLADSDPRVRIAAVQRLGKMGPPAAPAVRSLLSMLHEEGVVRGSEEDEVLFPDRMVLQAMERMGKPGMAALIAALSDRNPQVREDASEVLARIDYGDDPELIQVLMRVIKESRTRRIQTNALAALSNIGKGNLQIRAFLLETLAENPNGFLREVVAQAFSNFLSPDPVITDALLKSLRTDEDERVRRAAAGTLGRVDGDYRFLSDNLREAIVHDQAPGVRADAVQALGVQTAVRIGAAHIQRKEGVSAGLSKTYGKGLAREPDGLDESNLAAIVTALGTEESVVVQRAASEALALIGTGSGDVRSALRKAALENADETVRANCARALGSLADQDGQMEDVLIHLLREDKADRVRSDAARMLVSQPSDRRKIAEALISVLDEGVGPDLERTVCLSLATLTGGSGPRTAEEWKRWWAQGRSDAGATLPED